MTAPVPTYVEVLIRDARTHAKACEAKGLTSEAGAIRDLADCLSDALSQLAKRPMTTTKG